MPDTLYIIDGTNLIFRAYYAVRGLSTSSGFPTNAIYGFTNMILKLIKDEKPDYLAIAFDSGKPSFREDLYPKYKANRKEPPDDLRQQFPHMPRIVDALNIPCVMVEGIEADDIIGRIAKKAEKEGKRVVIVTGDKDFMQLVNEDISLLDTMKEKKIGVAEVIEKFGVSPEKVTDILGLSGDASDNIPGVAGVGPKTATRLIEKYGDIEALIKNSDKLDGALKDKIEKHADMARLSKKLATIHVDVDVDIDIGSFKVRPFDAQKLHDILKEFEFSSLLSQLIPKAGLPKDGYKLIMTEDELEWLCSELKSSKSFAFDTETTSLYTLEARLVGISFSWETGKAAYIPVGHTGLDAAGQLDREHVLKKLKPILIDKNIKKCAQNAKYDLEVLANYGVDVTPIECDTMIASYVLNPGGAHNLDDLAQQHLDHTNITYAEMVGKGKNEKNFSDVEVEKASVYSCEDADVTYRLRDIFMPKITGSSLESMFKNIEMPLMRVLVKMELAGVKVDKAFLGKLGVRFHEELKELETEIFKEAGEEFNISSPKQLGGILFDKLGLPGAKKTKTGYSTDVDVLNGLAGAHKLPSLVLEYRSLSKLIGTYIDALPELINKKTGRIHADFNQTVAETGRLSSSDPNLQNIPIRTEAGKKIREAFIAEEGFMLLSADYSQIELRILAHIAREPELINAFKSNVDVHAVTAAGIFDVPVSEVTSEQRSVGKTVNFATIYGQSSFGLSKQLKIEPHVAQEYIDDYFAKYKVVAKYRDEILKKIAKDGFVETLFGRRRYCPDMNSKNGNIRQNAERMAFNTIFQGTAADIIKRAMIEIDRLLPQVSPGSKMIIQVHDELVFEVPENDVKKVSDLVTDRMSKAADLSVPLLVDVGYGINWAEC